MSVGIFMAFFGLLFSGAFAPVKYRENIYGDGGEAVAIFSGLMTVTRFFIEGMAVQELRCLPEQSGFTVDPTSVNFPIDSVGTFHLVGLGQNDLSVVQRSFHGWYWCVLPSFMVGLSVRVLALATLHVSDRSRQNKKSLMYELKKVPLFRNRTFYSMVACVLVVTSLFATSAWLVVRKTGETGVSPPT
jgi:hypothetical protein